MIKLNDRNLLHQYLQRFGLDRIFDGGVIGCMNLYRFEKGESICAHASKLQTMYFLVSGKIKIYSLLANGKSLLLRFNKPLSVLGDLEFLTDYEVKCNVESVSESLLIGIPFEDLHNRADDNPQFLRLMVQNLSGKLYRSSISHSINALYPLEQRFAGYLISISSDENNVPVENEIATGKFTEIAEFLGASYRHLNRVINSLVAKKVLAKEKRIVKIVDFPKLKELSGGNVYE